MSLVDNRIIDAVAVTDDKRGIVLLLTDHINWEDEYRHLQILQEKINAYISFFEEKQYEDIYQEEDITYGIIEIHFLYDITSNVEKFLQVVQKQVNELNIKIQYYISEEGESET